jgi:hypothetical protein
MDKCSRCENPTTRLWYGRPMCEQHYDEKLKAELVCRICGGPLDDRDSPWQAVCSDCQYNDWHEEYPEVLPQEEGE